MMMIRRWARIVLFVMIVSGRPHTDGVRKLTGLHSVRTGQGQGAALRASSLRRFVLSFYHRVVWADEAVAECLEDLQNSAIAHDGVL